MNESCVCFAAGQWLRPLGLVAALGNTAARLAHGKRVGGEASLAKLGLDLWLHVLNPLSCCTE